MEEKSSHVLHFFHVLLGYSTIYDLTVNSHIQK